MRMAQGLGSRVSLPSSHAKHHSTVWTSHWLWLTMYKAGTAQRCRICRICLTKPMGEGDTTEDSS